MKKLEVGANGLGLLQLHNDVFFEALVFESSFNGQTGIISTRMCNDGYLYITFDGVTRGFNIGSDAYNRFMKDFELCTVVWTEEEPITIG